LKCGVFTFIGFIVQEHCENNEIVKLFHIDLIPFSAKSFFLLVCFAHQAVFFLLYWLFFGQQHFSEGRRIRYQPTMQMMDDEQPHTIKNTLNKYTIKGMELRKELVSTIMEMMFPSYNTFGAFFSPLNCYPV
jgi:hypothetical protein